MDGLTGDSNPCHSTRCDFESLAFVKLAAFSLLRRMRIRVFLQLIIVFQKQHITAWTTQEVFVWLLFCARNKIAMSSTCGFPIPKWHLTNNTLKWRLDDWLMGIWTIGFGRWQKSKRNLWLPLAVACEIPANLGALFYYGLCVDQRQATNNDHTHKSNLLKFLAHLAALNYRNRFKYYSSHIQLIAPIIQ